MYWARISSSSVYPEPTTLRRALSQPDRVPCSTVHHPTTAHGTPREIVRVQRPVRGKSAPTATHSTMATRWQWWRQRLLPVALRRLRPLHRVHLRPSGSELLIWGRSSLVGCDVICLRARYFDNPWWEGSGSEAGKRNGTFRDGSNHLAHTRRKVPFPKHYCRSSRTVPRASAIRSALYEKMAIGSISAASSRYSSTLRVTVALFGCLLLN